MRLLFLLKECNKLEIAFLIFLVKLLFTKKQPLFYYWLYSLRYLGFILFGNDRFYWKDGSYYWDFIILNHIFA